MTLEAVRATHDELAKLFITTVQGDFSPESCVLIKGALAHSEKPIPRATQPNLSLLAQLLRSTTPLPEQIETWVVELFNQQGDSTCRVKEIRRRKAGRPWNPRYRSWFDSLPTDTREAAMSIRNALADAGCTSDFCALHLALQNSRPLSLSQRAWLADIFAPASHFDFQVRTLVRRRRGAKPIGLNPSWFGWEAALKVEELLNVTYWEAAIAQVAREYGKGRSYIENAVQFRRIAKKIGAPVP